ncbi:MAG: hypothetical protein ACSW8H_02770, partial [bacterium]
MIQMVYNIMIGLLAAGVIAVVIGMAMILVTMIRRKDTDRGRTRIGSFVVLGGLFIAMVATTILLILAPQINGAV